MNPIDTKISVDTRNDLTTHARVALITGASRGLGLALARALVQRHYWLVIDARGPQALEQVRAELASASRVVAVPGDVSDPQHRRALVDSVRSLGGLDVLVNNASILGATPLPNLLDYPTQLLEQLFQVNSIAPLALIQSFRYLFRNNARILNITSDAGVEAYPGWGGYGSSKAAFEQLSAVLAAENPSWKVYRIDPGDMRTQMQQEAYPGEDISDRPLPEASVPGLLALIEGEYPSGRYKTSDVGNSARASQGQSQAAYHGV